MTQQTATELYKDAMGQLERIDHWRKGMMDKVREDSRRKSSLVRETFMVDELEHQFRNIAKNLFVDQKGGSLFVTGYVMAPEGVEVTYEDESAQDCFTYLITWEEVQGVIDKKLGSQKRLQQSLDNPIEA